ncbi:MAG TPA: hypothetical protein VLF69_06320 [Candidatus Saccharimonadales bacterium]|nr:hypothetical protein [Candidatus Saccharimonadales bacterium]
MRNLRDLLDHIRNGFGPQPGNGCGSPTCTYCYPFLRPFMGMSPFGPEIEVTVFVVTIPEGMEICMDPKCTSVTHLVGLPHIRPKATPPPAEAEPPTDTTGEEPQEV